MNALTMRTVRGAGGLTRHVPSFAVAAPAKRGRKARIVPDPIKTNGEAAAEDMRLLIERIERMDEEIRNAQDDRKDVLAEARGRGYDTKAMLDIIARRRKSREDVAERDAIMDTYLQALGMLA